MQQPTASHPKENPTWGARPQVTEDLGDPVFPLLWLKHFLSFRNEMFFGLDSVDDKCRVCFVSGEMHNDIPQESRSTTQGVFLEVLLCTWDEVDVTERFHCDYFNFMQQTEPLIGSTGSRYLGLCHFHHQGETNNWIFLSQTESTTSYRSVSPEFLGLLTGTSIQLAVNKGQEQQSLTPSSFSTASVQPWPMDVLWEKRVSSQRIKMVPGLMKVHLISLAKVNRKGMHLRYGNDILIVEGSGSQFACGALKGNEYRRKIAKLRNQSIWVGLQALASTLLLCANYLISMTLSFICRMRVMEKRTTSEG